MTFKQRRQEQQALVQHLIAQDWNVFGTLKFINGRTIGRSSADKILRSYWNKIDRVMFGKAAERQNMRVPRWCFAHGGADSENYHIHFVMPSPLQDTEYICCVLNAVWAQHHAQTASLAKNWIMPVQDQAAVASYVTHDYWRIGSDTILDELSWTAEQSYYLTDHALDERYTQQQAQRLSRAASPLWLRHSQQALNDQKSQYEASGDLQMMERG
jgi:hypothetical protein